MRGAGIRRFGGRVELMELAEPRPPAADEVLIEVRAAGVGNWDQVVRSGDWDVGRAPPLVLGVEASGVVLACGADVAQPRVGDAVLTHPLPLRDQGCWAERLLARRPGGRETGVDRDFQRRRSFRCPGLTAYEVLVESVAIRAGESLFVHGAGGATGGTIVRTGLALGARVIASAGAAARRCGRPATCGWSTTATRIGRHRSARWRAARGWPPR